MMIPHSTGRQPPSYPWDVFVSHNGNDLEWVNQFFSHLESSGLKVFFDKKSIPPGGAIAPTIENALQGSRFIVVVISRAALRSPWVGLERCLGLHLDPDSRHGRVIPVLLDPIEIDSLPLSLRVLRFIDLTQSDKRVDEYRLLLRHLGVNSGDDLVPPVLVERNPEIASGPTLVPYPTVDQIVAELESASQVDLLLAGGDTFYPLLSSALRLCHNRPRFRVLLRASSTASSRTSNKLGELSQKTGAEISVRWYDNDFMLRGYCFDRSRGHVSYFLRQGTILTGRRNPMLQVIRDRSAADTFLVDLFVSLFDSTFSHDSSTDPDMARRVESVREQ